MDNILKEILEKIQDSEELIWTDDDEYFIGYNSGLRMAAAIIKEYLCQKKSNCSMNGQKDSD